MLQFKLNTPGAVAVISASLRLVDAINDVDVDDLPEEVVDRYNEVVAVIDEHVEFSEVEA